MGILAQLILYSMQVTHSGMVRVVDPSLLQTELTTWCDHPLVLQAAAPGHK